MKIYTKKGDTGTTALFGGTTTTKSNQRICAYGSVDELNSTIGMVLAFGLPNSLAGQLEEVQQDLFVVGASLATPNPEKARIDPVAEERIARLEKWIDEMEAELPPLKTFILPGGGQAGAACHLARTVCRRAERETVALAEQEEIAAVNVTYLNRLSDLLFVLARYINQQQNAGETPWIPKR
ncbi:MAG: cob(I)yrinic acid a,c-diamide adenosyltransferase [Balneolaceae bacterium]